MKKAEKDIDGNQSNISRINFMKMAALLKTVSQFCVSLTSRTWGITADILDIDHSATQ